MSTTSSPPEPAARAWVDIDLDAVLANARQVASVSGARLMPMVKANGYGLGAVAVARALEQLDPWGFGVATVDEGAELRAAGIRRPIALFTPSLVDWIPAIRRHAITPVLCDLESLRAWLADGGDAPFHLGIDTGMARAGISHTDRAALDVARSLLDGAAGYEGISTHFHSSDVDAASTRRAWDDFLGVVAALGRRPPLVHAANSAAALEGRAYAADLVRPGIYLYGGRTGAFEPLPVAALSARVVAVRRLGAGDPVSYGATWRAPGPVTVATVAIGYADGLPRAFAPRGALRLGGAMAPVRGRVTMDMTVVETGGDVRLGDAATVFGDGLELDAQAACAGTIGYEFLTSLGRRVERRYHGGR